MRFNPFRFLGAKLVQYHLSITIQMVSTEGFDSDNPGTDIRFTGLLHILVPIAFFSSLRRRSLGTRIEGLWRHTIFELIRIFLIGCLKTKKSWAEVKMFARIAGWNSCDQRRLQCNNGGHGRFGRKFSQFFTAQHFSWLNTCRCCNKTAFLVDIFDERSSKQPEILSF